MTNTYVVKIGTSSVTNDHGAVALDALEAVARDVATLHEQGHRVVIVTSGAITAGWAAVGGGAKRPTDATTLQAVSAVGQPLLMDAWRAAFAPSGRSVGQVLVAPHDFADRAQYLHARGTIEALGALGVVPIVNENDAVADEEIRFGDNDRIAALVANLVGATALVLLTDTAGLLSADPAADPEASLIAEVRTIDASLMALASGSSSGVGSGGMASKLAAARMAQWSGIRTVIAGAKEPHALLRAVAGEEGFGTTVRARSARLSARKSWIAFAVPQRGTLVLNDGAVAAIVRDDRSLLRVGVVSADGRFVAGDVVELVDAENALVARGIVRCAVTELDTVDVVVHRDELVVLT